MIWLMNVSNWIIILSCWRCWWWLIHSELKYLLYSYIKNEDLFTKNLHSKPAVFKLISMIMNDWKNDHLNTINQVILHSKEQQQSYQTFIYYTDTWLTKKKNSSKQLKPHYSVKQLAYGLSRSSFIISRCFGNYRVFLP